MEVNIKIEIAAKGTIAARIETTPDLSLPSMSLELKNVSKVTKKGNAEK